MIWKDILLELRAIRIGHELQIKLMSGQSVDLRQQAHLRPETRAIAESVIARRAPKDYKAIIHRDDQKARNREILSEMGDDTPKMIDYVRAEFGEEAAEGMRRFYEEEV